MISRIRNLLPNGLNLETTLIGWVRTVRHQKKYSFIDLDDGSGNIQIIISSENIHSIVTGSSIQVTGQVVQGPKSLEIQANNIRILGNSDVVGIKIELPISQEVPYNGTLKRPSSFSPSYTNYCVCSKNPV